VSRHSLRGQRPIATTSLGLAPRTTIGSAIGARGGRRSRRERCRHLADTVEGVANVDRELLTGSDGHRRRRVCIDREEVFGPARPHVSHPSGADGWAHFRRGADGPIQGRRPPLPATALTRSSEPITTSRPGGGPLDCRCLSGPSVELSQRSAASRGRLAGGFRLSRITAPNTRVICFIKRPARRLTSKRPARRLTSFRLLTPVPLASSLDEDANQFTDY
jgi:hypothetical protein